MTPTTPKPCVPQAHGLAARALSSQADPRCTHTPHAVHPLPVGLLASTARTSFPFAASLCLPTSPGPRGRGVFGAA